MRRREDPEVHAWLDKARGDLVMADLARKPEQDLPDQALFHAQQAAEKALKALLVALDRPVPRTHDLLVLVDDLVDRFEELDALALDLARLSAYGVAPRYPGRWDDPDTTEVEAAIRIASKVLARTLELLAG